MKNRIAIMTLFLLLAWISCKQKQEPEHGMTSNENPASVERAKTLPPLEGGEVFYKNKEPFGEVINLIGESIVADTVIFKVEEAKLLIKGDYMVISNRYEGHAFMRFRLPEMEFMGVSGIVGRGPDEFNFPDLVPTTDTTFLCYLFESANQKIYRLEKNGEIKKDSFSFTPPKQGKYSDKEVVNIAQDDFIYVETSATGKSIFRSTKSKDSIITKEVFNLGLNPQRKSWVPYIGNFVVNPKQNRMAYAYKYFKIIKFMDMNAQTVRTINFEREEFDESTLYKIDGMDDNTTHYWGACAGDDYVYFYYSGRKPMEVVRDHSKKNYYAYIEQYDWNGNPIHKYKLDRWGYFTVDEKNKCIYLTSTNDDDPFFVFRMHD